MGLLFSSKWLAAVGTVCILIFSLTFVAILFLGGDILTWDWRSRGSVVMGESQSMEDWGGGGRFV